MKSLFFSLFFTLVFSLGHCKTNFSAPVTLGQPVVGGSRSPLGIDGANTTVAVWIEGEGSSAIVQGATLAFGSDNWIPTNHLSSPGSISVFSLAVNSAGQAVAVWINGSDIEGAILDLSGSAPYTWTATTFPMTSAFTYTPAVSINENGQAVVIWSDKVSVHGATLDVNSGTTWTPTSDLNNAKSDFLALFVDPTGQAVATWAYSIGGKSVGVYGAYLPPSNSTWQNNTALLPGNSADITSIEIAGDPNGNAVTVISVVNSSLPLTTLLSSSFNNSSKDWNGPLTIASDLVLDSFINGLVVNSSGEAFVAYLGTQGPFASAVFLTSLPLGGTAWTTPTLISKGGVQPQLFISPSDVISVLLAVEEQTTEQVRFSTLNPSGTEWSKQVTLSSEPLVIYPSGVAGSDGYFVASWFSFASGIYSLGEFKVSHSVTSPVPPPPHPSSVQPPYHLKGKQITNHFLFQGHVVNELTWKSPLAGTTPVLYKIYRDAALTNLLGIVPADEPLVFEDQSIKKGVTYTYYVVSESNRGKQSLPAKLTIKG